MITTEYKPEHREQVLELVKEFEAEFLGEFGLGVNDDVFDQAIETQAGTSFLLFIDGKLEGLLSGVLMHAFAIKGLTWQENIWYVRKPYRNGRYGLALFKYAQAKLKEAGVNIMVMAHLANETGRKIGRLYEKLGFKPLETHYIRRLQ